MSDIRINPTAAPVRVPPIGLAQFGIPLGVCGLAGAWTAAESTLAAAEWVPDVLWAVGALLWLGVGGAYVVQRRRATGAFSADLRHPIIGPFAAYAPIIALLLMTHFGQYIPDAAAWIVWALVFALLAVAARLVAHWLIGDLTLSHLHPGYFLPVVAGSFVGSIGLSSVRAHDAADAAFGVGIFFWLVIGTIVTGRLITGGPLPGPVKSTLSVLLVPPAVGGIAWLFLNGGRADGVGFAFLGVMIFFVVVQLILVPTYARLPFSAAFWTFTFPVASAANFTIRWCSSAPFPVSAAVAWLVLVLATIATTTVAVISITVLVLAAKRASGKEPT